MSAFALIGLYEPPGHTAVNRQIVGMSPVSALPWQPAGLNTGSGLAKLTSGIDPATPASAVLSWATNASPPGAGRTAGYGSYSPSSAILACGAAAWSCPRMNPTFSTTLVNPAPIWAAPQVKVAGNPHECSRNCSTSLAPT